LAGTTRDPPHHLESVTAAIQRGGRLELAGLSWQQADLGGGDVGRARHEQVGPAAEPTWQRSEQVSLMDDAQGKQVLLGASNGSGVDVCCVGVRRR